MYKLTYFTDDDVAESELHDSLSYACGCAYDLAREPLVGYDDEEEHSFADYARVCNTKDPEKILYWADSDGSAGTDLKEGDPDYEIVKIFL